MKKNVKTVIVTQAILLGILAVVIIFLVVSYENSEEKTEIKGLEDKIMSLEANLAKKTQEYEWLKELNDYALSNNGKLPPIETTEPFKST